MPALSLSLLQIITSKSFQMNDERAKELTEMAHQGIRLLMSWTTAVMELVSTIILVIINKNNIINNCTLYVILYVQCSAHNCMCDVCVFFFFSVFMETASSNQ